VTVEQLQALSRRERRLLALAALTGCLLLFYVLVIWPASAVIGSQSEWRENASERLSRYRALAAQKVELERQLQEATTHPIWSGLLAGTDVAAATTTLQSELRSLLDAHKIAVQVSAPLDAQRGARIARVGVRVNVDLTIDQLQAFLESVQRHSHRFALDNVIVTAPQYQAPDQNPSLNVQMEVWGFMRSPTPTEAGA